MQYIKYSVRQGLIVDHTISNKMFEPVHRMLVLRPEIFYKLIYGNCFSDLGLGGRKKK